MKDFSDVKTPKECTCNCESVKVEQREENTESPTSTTPTVMSSVLSLMATTGRLRERLKQEHSHPAVKYESCSLIDDADDDDNHQTELSSEPEDLRIVDPSHDGKYEASYKCNLLNCKQWDKEEQHLANNTTERQVDSGFAEDRSVTDEMVCRSYPLFYLLIVLSLMILDKLTIYTACICKPRCLQPQIQSIDSLTHIFFANQNSMSLLL